MATRKTTTKKTVKSTKRAVPAGLVNQVRNQAQDLWMAGLGVIANAQDQGARVVDTLRERSRDLQGRVAETADTLKDQMEERVAKLREAELAERVSARLNKLGQIVETRTADALGRAGVATKKDVQSLSRRVAKLGAEVEKLAALRKVVVKPAAKPAPKPVAKRAVKPVAAEAAA